jgi:catechol 2,3-dioxygenase-like lactoylglutathione lyase family enzyme
VSGSVCANRVRNLFQGTHLVLYASDPDQARAFFQNVLGLESVDAGSNWLIFALPPAELAVHPTDGEPRAELYLMCDDIELATTALSEHGAPLDGEIQDAGFGRLAHVRVPGIDRLGVYQPSHPSPLTG